MTSQLDRSGGSRKTRSSTALGSPRNIVWLGLTIISVTVFVAAARVSMSVQDIQARIAVVEHVTQGDSVPDISLLRNNVGAIRNDLAVIRSDAGWLFPLTPLVGWLPEVGGDLAASADLFNMADAVVRAADVTLRIWTPVAGGNAVVSPSGADGLMAVLTEARPQLQLAGEYLTTASYYRARITPALLSARTLALVDRFDRIMPFADLAVTGGLALPDLLGAAGSRTYLIVAQNEDERRATGGFVSAAGLLIAEHGKITSLEFMDSYQVDNLDQDFPSPPAPLEKYMLAGYWLFRDANWSPDFPSSARQLAAFYEMGKGKHVDGVIALDQEMVRLLVQAAGPFDVPGNPPRRISADNILNIMREAWVLPANVPFQEAMLVHKSFIGNIAKALQSHLLEGGPPNVTALAHGIYESLRGHHLLLYFPSSPLAKPLERLGWDGALRASSGDYIMVVDSNVGFTKADALVNRQYKYVATIASDLSVSSALSIQYRHEATRATPGCTQALTPYGPNLTYEMLMNQCYWDYLRLYVPGGSSLIDATRYPIPAARLLNRQASTGDPEILAPENGKTAFATFFVLERGEEKELRFEYDLPGAVIQHEANGIWTYRLYWQKQPGTTAIPTQITLILPRGATIARVIAPSSAVTTSAEGPDGLHLNYSFVLDTDATIEVLFHQS
jgi:Protein of unknown function (DUF4012)